MSASLTSVRRASLGLVISAIVIGAFLWVRWSSFNGALGIDFDVYARGGLAILQGESLYDVSVNGLPFTYPPFSAVLFTSLSLAPIEVGQWLVTSGSLVSYLMIVFVCARSARLGWPPATLVGAAGLTLEPFFTSIDLGQIDLYLILMVALDCLVVPSRHRGWLVGLATGLKLVPAVFIVYFVLKRDWRATGRTVAGFAVSVLFGALVAPSDSWRYWTGGLLDVGRFGAGVSLRADNQSFLAEFIRLSHDLNPSRVVWIGLAVVALLFATLVAKRQFDAGRPLDALVALGLGSVLASPVSWTHHWLWVVPLLVVTVSRRWWITSWALGAVFLIGPMALVPMGNFQELKHSWWQAIVSASYILAGIAMLVRILLVQPPGTTTADDQMQVGSSSQGLPSASDASASV